MLISRANSLSIRHNRENAVESTLNGRVRYPTHPACSGQPINRFRERGYLANLRQSWDFGVQLQDSRSIYGSDIHLFVTLQISQQVSRAGHTKGAAIEDVRVDHCRPQIAVAGGWFADTSGQHSASNSLLVEAGIQMMAALFSATRVAPTASLGKHPLPTPFHQSIGILARQSMRQQHAPPAVGKILAWGSV